MVAVVNQLVPVVELLVVVASSDRVRGSIDNGCDYVVLLGLKSLSSPLLRSLSFLAFPPLGAFPL